MDLGICIEWFRKKNGAQIVFRKQIKLAIKRRMYILTRLVQLVIKKLLKQAALFALGQRLVFLFGRGQLKPSSILRIGNDNRLFGVVTD